MFSSSSIIIFCVLFFIYLFIKKVFCFWLNFNSVFIMDSLYVDIFNNNKNNILLFKIFNLRKKKNKKYILPITTFNILYLNDIFFKNKYHLNKVCNLSLNYKFNIFVKKDNSFLFKRRKNRVFFKKIHIIINNLAWFLFTFFYIKHFVYLTIKIMFYKSILRNNFLKDKINILFFETKDINFLSATLISNYIIRNLRIGHTLNRIIYPLMRHLQESQYVLYNGWKIGCFGRFKRTGRARKMWYGKIGVPLNTLTANIDYAKSIVRLRNGLCCIKVFITRTSVYSYLI